MFSQLDRRGFLIILGGIVILLLTASSAYAIWPQVKDIRKDLIIRDQLKELSSNKDALDVQQKRLMLEVEEIKFNMKGDMADVPEKKIESFIIGELHTISSSHDINLKGVKPMQGNQIQMFQEVLFNVQLTGEYFDLYEWLHDLRDQLGFIVIKNLELNLSERSINNSKLIMKLTIAIYKHS